MPDTPAARERPSALDVETELRKWARYARSEANRRTGNPDRRDDAANLLAGGIQLAWADRLDAILARLTEPDAGEGTETPTGNRARWLLGVDEQYDYPTPDTTEATLAHIAWAQDVRSEHEATHGEAEQCGAECIALGLAEFDYEYPA